MAEYESYQSTSYCWFPKVPSHWLKKSIRQITSVLGERCGDRDYRLLSVYREYGVIPKDSRDDNHNKESLDLSNYKVVHIGDLVLNKMKMWQGSLGVSQYEGIVSPAYIICKVLDKDINLDYLHLLLRSACFKSYYNQYSYGIRVGQWDMHYEDFKNLKVYMPPRTEQDQIVRFLDWKVSKINKKVALKRRSLDLIKELINSAFAALVENKAETVRLKRVVSLENDYIEINPDESYRKAGMYNRGRGIFLRDAVSGKEMGDSKFQRIHSGRLMLSGQFAWEDAVFVTSFKDEEGVASHRYYLLKSENKDVPVEYLFGYFISQKGFTDLQQCSHGSAGRNRPLNINELLRIEIPIVHNSESIRKLCNLVQVYMTMRPLVLHEEEILDELRNRIISDVVTGKIDVRNVTIPEYEHIDDIYDDNNEDSEETDETEIDGEEA